MNNLFLFVFTWLRRPLAAKEKIRYMLNYHLSSCWSSIVLLRRGDKKKETGRRRKDRVRKEEGKMGKKRSKEVEESKKMRRRGEKRGKVGLKKYHGYEG